MEDLVSIKDRLTQLDGQFPMDEAVIEALPKPSTFVSAEQFETSAWTLTGKITARETDGSDKLYFLKVAYGEHGATMLNGEWESSKIIYGLMPDLIPEPFAFGKYKKADPATYFYLSEFIDMDLTTAPEPEELTSRLAEMHRLSDSLNGKFGFHVTTCDGKTPHTVQWQDSWAEFFRRLLVGLYKLDLKTNGPWPELERATEQLTTKIIPRLLGALQSEGRQIKPCIIHGDLWEGNVGINQKTGKPVLFDAGSYYAHNEMELGHWRCEFSSHFRSKTYTEHYLRKFPIAEPQVEFGDRNRLYSIKGAINYAAEHPGSNLRKTAYNNMCCLCEKYAPIERIDNYDPNNDPSITGARIVPHVAEELV